MGTTPVSIERLKTCIADSLLVSTVVPNTLSSLAKTSAGATFEIASVTGTLGTNGESSSLLSPATSSPDRVVRCREPPIFSSRVSLPDKRRCPKPGSLPKRVPGNRFTPIPLLPKLSDTSRYTSSCRSEPLTSLTGRPSSFTHAEPSGPFSVGSLAPVNMCKNLKSPVSRSLESLKFRPGSFSIEPELEWFIGPSSGDISKQMETNRPLVKLVLTFSW